MSFGAPKAPDPTATANAQQQYNVEAAGAQNRANSYNQETPFGSVSYVADASSPSGYRVVTNTGATGQKLLGAASNLADNSVGMYSQAPNLDAVTGDTAKLLNSWQQRYVQPIFNQQDSNLEAQLRSQGLTPGSEAYNNAKNLLARNQGDVTNDYLTKNEAQAYGQALQNYQLPLETIGGLFQTAAPGQFQQTPTASIQPANYQGAVQANYENQMKNYENTWNNIGKLGGSVLNLAMAPTTGGTSMAGMFGKGPGGGWGNMFMGGGSPTGL
jgi:hypothetical protein